ncbi:MAG TPA: hypothetical protein VFZ38_10740 [Vicinamibacterales bacterium]
MLTPPANGETLTIYRLVPVTQGTDLANQGRFYPETHETALDRLTMIAQQHDASIARSLRGSILGDVIAEIPSAEDRAGKYLGFDAVTSDPIVLPDTDGFLRADLSSTAPGKGAALVSATQAVTYAAGTLGAHYNDAPSVKDAPYNVTNSGDQAAKFSTIRAISKSFTIPAGAYTLASAPTTGPASFMVSPNATFSGAGTTNNLPDFFRGTWPDTDGGCNVWRFQDRVFIGKPTTGNRVGAQNAYATSDAVHGLYMYRDAKLLSVHERGMIAVSGVSRSGEQVAPYLIYNACIGVSGAVINDRSDGLAWALYSDVQHENSSGTSYGCEFALKNKGANKVITPYGVIGSPGTGVIGLHMVAGGDPSYGGAATNPTTCAINLTPNAGAQTFNVGINVVAGALTVTGGIANIVTASRNQVYRWMRSTTDYIGAVYADGTVGGTQEMRVVLRDGRVEIQRDTNAYTFGVADNVVQASTGSGVAGGFEIRDAGTLRWRIEKSAGGTFNVLNYDAAGAFVDTPFAAQSGAAGSMSMGGATRGIQITSNQGRLNDGAADKIRWNTTGIGFYGAAPVARQTYGAPTGGAADRTTFDTTTVTTAQLAQRVRAIIDDLRSNGLFA